MTSPQRDERLRDGLAAVAEWEAEHGALTEEELDAARRRIGVIDPSALDVADASSQIIDV